jgi:hypothetical protein
MEEAGFRNPRNQPGYLTRHCEYVLVNCAACQKIKERKPVKLAQGKMVERQAS